MSSTPSTSSPDAFPPASSDLLRALVLDYLVHHSYLNTARAFVHDSAQHGLGVAEVKNDGAKAPTDSERRESASGDVNVDENESAEDEDEDEDFLPQETLRQTRIRREIKFHILSGRIAEARELLLEHFPSVLDDSFSTTSEPQHEPEVVDPESSSQQPKAKAKPRYDASTKPHHLSLNLSIQSFIEATRTVPLTYPAPPYHTSSPPSPTSPIQTLPSTPSQPSQTQTPTPQPHLLHLAQSLWSTVSSLTLSHPHDVPPYREELKNVCTLLAFPVPERSPDPARAYLSMKRREAVAEQVNCAVVATFGGPSVSYLELVTRRVGAAHSVLNELKVPSVGLGYPYPYPYPSSSRSQSRPNPHPHPHPYSPSHSVPHTHSHTHSFTNPHPHPRTHSHSHTPSFSRRGSLPTDRDLPTRPVYPYPLPLPNPLPNLNLGVNPSANSNPSVNSNPSSNSNSSSTTNNPNPNLHIIKPPPKSRDGAMGERAGGSDIVPRFDLRAFLES